MVWAPASGSPSALPRLPASPCGLRRASPEFLSSRLFCPVSGGRRLASGLLLASVLLLASGLWRPASAQADLFAGSDTYVVSNAASAVIVVSNAPVSGGAPLAWHPAGILANFRDSPTGAVLRVSHVRQGIVNRHVNTNAGGTISVTNVLYTSGTGTTDALIWDPTNRYTIVPTNDALRIETSSTNAEIILNKEIIR